MAGLSLNGVVQVLSATELAAQERQQVQEDQSKPLIQGLAQYVKDCFEASKRARENGPEKRMLQNQRARNGQYDPEIQIEINKTGGSEIYMMLTSNKCRAASSWIRDVMFGTRGEKAWSVEPTSLPQLSPGDTDRVAQQAYLEAMTVEQAMGQPVFDQIKMQELVSRVKDRMTADLQQVAKDKAKRMEDKMEDQLQEGRFYRAMSEFIDDLVTFPAAVFKGPVMRKKPVLTWAEVLDAKGQGTSYTPTVQDEIVMEWERVDPFMFYPSPDASDIEDGYMIERHKLSRSALNQMIGVDGYDDAAIRLVLDEYGKGGLHNWLQGDSEYATAQDKSQFAMDQSPERSIEALQFHGSVQGKMLIEWGMEEEKVPDPTGEYNCEIWTIGQYVIKAMINPDPLGRKPYYKTSYEEIPGNFWGNSVADLIRDCQIICNATARSLANNMSIASGPQVSYNISRLPTGEDITQMYPWKIWQHTTDPYGDTTAPVSFFQPQSNAQELMLVYQQFATLADDYSGVPRYVTGDSPGGGAGRTASGLSMLLGNAGKTIKQVVGNIDLRVMMPLLERLYYYNMQYSDDPELKGDVRVIARGATTVAVKEQLQVRRNEFMQLALNNPIVGQIVGEEAIAALLRQVADGLEMDTDKVVPPAEVIRARIFQAQQQAQLLALQQANTPENVVQFQRDGQGAVQSAKVMPGNRQKLVNGAAPTDNFAPKRQ